MVEGIGGIILLSNNVRKLADWYSECLGVQCAGEDGECKSVYATFEVRDLVNPDVKHTMAWAIMHTDEDLSGKPRTGCINYRVKNMGGVLEHLRAKGVAVEKIQEFPYGKFASVRDLDGNKVELWESAE